MTEYSDEWWNEFKDIPGYEGYYQCNRLGQVRSLDRFVTHKNGKPYFVKGKNLKEINASFGYLTVHISKDSKHTHLFIHKLVAMTFIPNPENKSEVNHMDCNKKNNRITNLEWVTPRENTYHAYANKLIPKDKLDIFATNVSTGESTYYPSVRNFEETTNSISANLHLHNGTICNGYMLRFADEEKQKHLEDVLSKKQPIGGNTPVPIKCVETGQVFPSVRKCGIHFGIDDDLIRNAIRFSSGYVKKYKLTFVVQEDTNDEIC